MAERRRNWEKSGDDLPVYLARPGTADQVPRQKHGGLFCSIEDAFESKTIDFDALSVGQRGSRTPRSTKRLTGLEAKSPASDSKSSPAVESPTADKQERKGSPQMKIGTSGGKEILQNLEDEKVKRLTFFFFFFATNCFSINDRGGFHCVSLFFLQVLCSYPEFFFFNYA